MSVSYTHLDVYKRQILNSKELAALENKQIEESASEILSDEKTAERLVEKRNEKNAELDVYKRQILYITHAKVSTNVKSHKCG